MGARSAISECLAGGHAKSVLARIDLVIRTEIQRHLHINDRVTSKDTPFHGVHHTFAHRRNILARNDTALDPVNELESGPCELRLKAQTHVAILTASTCLLDVAGFLLHRLADGLAIRHLRLAHVCVDAELPSHAIDNNLQVQLAHTRNDGLTGLLIRRYPERRVLLS